MSRSKGVGPPKGGVTQPGSDQREPNGNERTVDQASHLGRLPEPIWAGHESRHG